MIVAAQATGAASARVTIPDLPDDCRKHVGRVYPRTGEKARWTQRRWEFSADAVDRQIDRCAAFHDDFKRGIETEGGVDPASISQ